MTSIFLAERGQYSDYRVERAFSTHEKAMEWIANAQEGYGSYSVLELPLDDMSDPPRSVLSVSLSLETGDVDEGGFHISADREEPKQGICIGRSWDSRRDVFLVQTFELDKTRAVKIANEKRTQMKALGRTDPGSYNYDTLLPEELEEPEDV